MLEEKKFSSIKTSISQISQILVQYYHYLMLFVEQYFDKKKEKKRKNKSSKGYRRIFSMKK